MTNCERTRVLPVTLQTADCRLQTDYGFTRLRLQGRRRKEANIWLTHMVLVQSGVPILFLSFFIFFIFYLCIFHPPSYPGLSIIRQP